MIAAEIVEDLQVAFDKFAVIAASLDSRAVSLQTTTREGP